MSNVIQLHPEEDEHDSFIREVVMLRERANQCDVTRRGRIFAGTDIPALAVNLLESRPADVQYNHFVKLLGISESQLSRWSRFKREGRLHNGMQVARG